MSELSIQLEGFPEKVQRIADALEEAFPGMVVWVQSEGVPDGNAVKIEGYEAPSMPMRASRSQAA